MLIRKYILLSTLISCLLFFSCEKEATPKPTSPIPDNSKAMYNLLKEWYLWNKEVPDTLNINNYPTAKSVLERCRHKHDKWSNVSNLEETQKYYQNAQYVGLGFSYSWLSKDDLRVAFVFKNSPFDKNGIKRGWRIVKINGTVVNKSVNISNLFGESQAGLLVNIEFQKPNGEITTLSIAKETLTFNTVLHSSVHSVGDVNVGYLVFQSFVNTSKAELDIVISDFIAKDVKKLILDLRYNGGGLADVAHYLANLIANTQANKKVLAEFSFNDDKAPSNNTSYYILKSKALELDEIVFLVSKSTASASELIINGLRPLMKTKTIGTGNTYGKPAGANVFQHNEYAFTIIIFLVKNSVGYGEYFDGLSPDFISCDALDKDFGDPTETMFGDALSYLRTGTVSGCTPPSSGGRLGTELINTDDYSNNPKYKRFEAIVE